jgi:hypothetical protein
MGEKKSLHRHMPDMPYSRTRVGIYNISAAGTACLAQSMLNLDITLLLKHVKSICKAWGILQAEE